MPRFHRALGVIVIDLLFYGHLLLSSSGDGVSQQLLTQDATTKDNATGSRGTLSKTPCRVPAKFFVALLVGKPLYFPVVKSCS